MTFVYPAIFHKEENEYWVEFPDLEGCYTCGSSLAETVAYAQEALSVYLLELISRSEFPALPSDISSLRPSDGFTSLVSCDVNPYEGAKAVKKTVTIPSWLNDSATAAGLSFSKTLQDALLAKIHARL